MYSGWVCVRGTWPRRLMIAAVASVALAGCGGGRHHVQLHPNPAAGVGWRAPNGDRANTRWVGGPIHSSSVARLHRAWSVPVGDYASTPVIVGGVVYTQDLNSNVYAIDLRRGTVLWRKLYRERDIGPNGINVAGGRIYGATPRNAFALSARTGKQLWSRRLVRNGHEGIDMAPGYDRGTVYVSTVPVNLQLLYGGGARGILWALDARTGRPRWRWAQVPAGLWGHPRINSGGGLWHPPAFDDAGGLYISIGNPGPYPGAPGFPWGASRPGSDRWTNSIVKLDAASGRFAWGRQVLPHDVYDWDLEGPVVLTRAGGRPIAVTAGKMGVVLAFDRDAGTLLWKTPVGRHNGHDHDNLRALRGHLHPSGNPSKILPGGLGGVETQMATDGDAVYVPVNNLYAMYQGETTAGGQDLMAGTGEVVALDVATGQVKWDRKLPHSVYGAATVANDVVFTTTFDGTVWALRSDTGETLWTAKLRAPTNAPVAVAGDTIVTASTVLLSSEQKTEIVAYRLRPRVGAASATGGAAGR